MKKEHREAIQMLRRLGATDVQLVPGKKHLKLRYLFNGQLCQQTTCATPSDFRWRDQFAKDFRRAVRQSAARVA